MPPALTAVVSGPSCQIVSSPRRVYLPTRSEAVRSSWQATALHGFIPPGRHYLVQEAAGAGGSIDLPTPDASGSITMSATNGKVALVSSTALLTGTCPTGGAIVDFVGYGSANCFETAATPALTNTTAALRLNDGATDTNDNAADFVTGVPVPRPSTENAPAIASTCGCR